MMTRVDSGMSMTTQEIFPSSPMSFREVNLPPGAFTRAGARHCGRSSGRPWQPAGARHLQTAAGMAPVIRVGHWTERRGVVEMHRLAGPFQVEVTQRAQRRRVQGWRSMSRDEPEAQPLTIVRQPPLGSLSTWGAGHFPVRITNDGNKSSPDLGRPPRGSMGDGMIFFNSSPMRLPPPPIVSL